MDLAAATNIVRSDMNKCHPGTGSSTPVDWSDDQVLYDFILGTTEPDTDYTAYKPELAAAYTVVHAHVYRHLATEANYYGDPHTLCNSPRCTLGEGHTLPCNELATTTE